MTDKLIFIIQGYEIKTPEGALMDLVTFELLDKTAESALARAKKLVKKPFYRVSQVLERSDHGSHT